ncbi:hypothetical protein F4779DRAFT_573899 [Xylariaceae sp. FL0662B]|nr:hypothetical protein F4779DRAFT_573899 [Xylariaceae sp. FL0662B]
MLYAMAPSHLSIDSLPNEILIQVLSSFSTRSLLPLAAVCRRFCGLVGRVHYARLIEATVLQDHQVILECCHPTDKMFTPKLFCQYLGTDGLSEAGDVANLGDLNRLYARFRPFVEIEHTRPRTHGPADAVTERTEGPTVEPAVHEIHLESGELLTQLCTLTDLVKVGPGHGVLLSIANVADGVIRVWRDWLQNEAAKTARTKQRTRTSSDDPSILWTDPSKNVGLKFRVIEEQNKSQERILPYEEPPVSYSLEYEELFIRTNQLLLSFETSEAQQAANTGAVYFTGSSIRQPCHAVVQCVIPMAQMMPIAPMIAL